MKQAHLLLALLIFWSIPTHATTIDPRPVVAFFNDVEKHGHDLPNIHHLSDEKIAITLVQQAAAVERLAHFLTYTNTHALVQTIVPIFFTTFAPLGGLPLNKVRFHHIDLVRRRTHALLRELERNMLTIRRDDTLTLQMAYDVTKVVTTFQHFFIPDAFPHAPVWQEAWAYAMAYPHKKKVVAIAVVVTGACALAWRYRKQRGKEREEKEKIKRHLTVKDRRVAELESSMKTHATRLIERIHASWPEDSEQRPPSKEELATMDFIALFPWLKIAQQKVISAKDVSDLEICVESNIESCRAAFATNQPLSRLQRQQQCSATPPMTPRSPLLHCPPQNRHSLPRTPLWPHTESQ